MVNCEWQYNSFSHLCASDSAPRQLRPHTPPTLPSLSWTLIVCCSLITTLAEGWWGNRRIAFVCARCQQQIFLSVALFLLGYMGERPTRIIMPDVCSSSFAFSYFYLPVLHSAVASIVSPFPFNCVGARSIAST